MSTIHIKDMLLGIAIGDAFGAGVEFQDRNWILEHVDFSKFVNARHLIPVSEVQLPTFTQNYKPWDYTDDTEMTIGLIKALLANDTFSEKLLIKHWTAEYQLGIQQKGYGRNGHGSMRWVFDGVKTIEEVRVFQADRQYPGNAPPMRVVPLSLLPSFVIDSFAAINAKATHPHPKAIAASILVARAAYYLLTDQQKSSTLISACIKHIEQLDTETSELLSKIDTLPHPTQLTHSQLNLLCGPQPIKAPRFLPGINGLPSDAMLTAGAALYILKHASNAFEGLKWAINLGGDVDSVASICTGILAGKYTLSSLPDFMLENVEGKAYLSELAIQFENFLAKLHAK